MIFTMVIDNTIIETKVLNHIHLSTGGYLQGLKNDMLERNEDIIDLTQKQPEFYIAVRKEKENLFTD